VLPKVDIALSVERANKALDDEAEALSPLVRLVAKAG